MKTTKKKRPTVRQMLNQIDKFLAVGDEEAKKLWAVLSATRGPDKCTEGSKTRHTIPIRATAFPKTAKNSGRIPANFYQRCDYAPIHNNLALTHFMRHVKEAAKVLGLQ